MKVTRTNHLFILSAILLGGAAHFSADAASVTVTSNPLWTDTGITLTPADTVIVHGATGSWTVVDLPIQQGGWPWVGPEGNNIPGFEWDEWIANGHHAMLIGFVGQNPYVASQNDPRLFEVSTNSVTLTNKQGRLWLGMNDAWSGGGVGDNAGSVVAQVDLQKPPIVVTIQVSCVDICWNSETNQMYQVQYQSTLTTNSWVNLGTPVPGSLGTTCVTDSVRSIEKRFYRVTQLP